VIIMCPRIYTQSLPREPSGAMRQAVTARHLLFSSVLCKCTISSCLRLFSENLNQKTVQGALLELVNTKKNTSCAVYVVLSVNENIK
jgi:hypothetical protein